MNANLKLYFKSVNIICNLLVDWNEVVLTGQSQGALLAGYFGMAVHPLAGIGSLAGGTYRTSGSSLYLPYVTDPYPLTDPSRYYAS